MDTRIIGNKIAEARKKVNMSQSQLAQQVFVSPQAVGKWERGESIPDIITFSRLAEVLGVDLNYFSDNFPSVPKDRVSGDSLGKQPEELPIGKQNNKLSWNMSSGNWVDADFSGLKNLHEKFNSSNMQRCKFIGSVLSGLLLKGNHIDSCDFSGSDLTSSYFQKSHLVHTLFKDCSLQKSEFSGSHLSSCDFSDADCTEATFKGCSLQKNTMTNVVLHHTAFHATDLNNMVFEGTLEDCYFEDCTFSKVTFQNSTLSNTFFKGKSLKRIQFINCHADRITCEFLRNGKADLSGITLLTT